MYDSVVSMGSDVAVMVSAIAASIAAGLSYFALTQVKNSQQSNLINSVLSDINQIDSELITLMRLFEETKNIELTKNSRNQLLSKLFSKIDWMCFLIIHKKIKDNSIKKYLHRLIISYYESTFTELATDDMKKDTEYREFKKLYEKIKDEF